MKVPSPDQELRLRGRVDPIPVELLRRYPSCSRRLGLIRVAAGLGLATASDLCGELGEAPSLARRPWLALEADDLVEWALSVVVAVRSELGDEWPAGKLSSLVALVERRRSIGREELLAGCRAAKEEREVIHDDLRWRASYERLAFERSQRQALASDLVCRLGGMALASWESPRPSFPRDSCLASVLRAQGDAFAESAKDYAAFTGSSEDPLPRWPGRMLRAALWRAANRQQALSRALG